MLQVVEPGPGSAIQDRGRPGFAHLGIPPSGACDLWALAAACTLAGTSADAAAVEVSFGGAELRVLETCAVILCGADLGAERDDGTPLAPAASHRLPAGARIRFTGANPGWFRGPASGARAYLCLAGGIVAHRVLGSAATLEQAGLGGVAGRGLRAGDILEPVRRGDLSSGGRTWPSTVARHPADLPGPNLFVPGPDQRHTAAETAAAFGASEWTVTAAGDRMGLRLDGPPLPAGHEILSHPLVPGSIQLPPDGRPIVVLADGPTLGGYPVIGVVPRAEMPRIAQLAPGDTVKFAAQDVAAARAEWVAQQRALTRAGLAVRAAAAWQRVDRPFGPF